MFIFCPPAKRSNASLQSVSNASSSSDAGGLLQGQESSTIAGPPGIEAYVNAFRPYTNTQQQIRVEQLPSPPEGSSSDSALPLLVESDFVSIRPIVLRPLNASGAVRLQHGTKRGNSDASDGGPAGPSSEQEAAAGKRQRTEEAKVEEMGASEVVKVGNGVRDDPAASLLASLINGGWSPPEEVACYVCEFKGVPGKFDPR